MCQNKFEYFLLEIHDKIYKAYWFTVASFAKVFTVAFTQIYNNCSPSYCWAYCQCCHRLPCKNHQIHKKFTRSEKNSLNLNYLRRRSQFCLKWFRYLLYRQKNLTCAHSLKWMTLKPGWKISFQQSSCFFQELKMTPLGTYKRFWTDQPNI